MSQSLLRKVISCPDLPTLPAVAVEVLELTRDQNVELNELAGVIQNDAAITSKILKTVNSSFYGLQKPCPSISRALGYLGLNTVKSLVLGFSLVDAFRSGSGERAFDLVAYWRRGVYGAAAARLLAERTRACDPEEAFIAALLQDVGMLAMSTALRDEYSQVAADAGCDHDQLPTSEIESFGFSHPIAGFELGQKWRLPDELVVPVRHHHTPEKAPSEFRDMSRIIAMGNDSSAALTLTEPKPKLERFAARGRSWFGLRGSEVEAMLCTIVSGANELSSLFQLQIGDIPDVEAVVAEAQEQILAHQISMDRRAQELQQTAETLTRETMTDGLTQIANRRQFDAAIVAAHAEALLGDGSLGVLFSDVDRFKSVNDTHGHQAGDAVLVELARRLSETVGDRGLVCRYGGEEFAVLLPQSDTRTIAGVAEACRQAIEAAPFDLRHVEDTPDTLPITISIGAAVLDSSTSDVFAKPDLLVQAADKAVYAAKEAGRNCVRIYRPRRSAERAPEPAPRRQTPPLPPVATAPTPMPPDLATPSSAAASTPPATAKFRVLLVEDDPLHAAFIQSAVASSQHVELLTAGTAAEAHRLLDACLHEGSPPALILCDVDLGGVPGYEFVRQVLRLPAMRLVPVVMISASRRNEDIVAALEAGARAYITKDQLAQDPAGRLSDILRFWQLSSRVA
jgi:diguanylate cyclase (GGDEF)-like protein